MATRFSVSKDGTRIAYDVTGQGPALMLLHGAGKTRQDWGKVGYVDRLKDDFTVIAIDIRGTVDALGPAEVRVTRSQVAFRRSKAFAWAWVPDRYLHGRHAPLVLTLSFAWRDSSPRWKEIVEPAPGRFTHHLEMYSAAEVDDQVRCWLQEVWQAAA